MFPAARSKDLTVQELSDETLVFDHPRNKAHCLNGTTTLVWKQCDGRTSPAEIARRIGAPAVIVELALEQLARRHLLQGNVHRASAENRRSRRELLKKLAVAAVAMPVIMTVAAPKANAAASVASTLACNTTADCSSLNLPGGCTIAICSGGKCTMTAVADNTQCSVNGDTGNCQAGVCLLE